MALSGEEQIVAALVTRLEGVTAANGFETDVGAVIRWDESNDWLGHDVAIVIVQASTDYDHADSFGQVQATVRVMLELTLANYDPTARETAVNNFLADVQKRLAPDPVNAAVPLGDGTLCYDLRWGRADRFLRGGDTPRAGATMLVQLFTHLDRTDPYQIVNCT
jgi:hypothetical protein